MKTIFAGFLFSFLIINSSFPQNTYDFLRMDMSARAGALAGSFVSNSDDPNVIFYNPAGLNLLEGNSVSFSFVKHLLDINLASVAYSTAEFENIGRFGAAVKYISYGSFMETDEFGQKLGRFNVNEAALILGYGNTVEENFYYGANIKFIYSNIGGISSSALAFDIGFHYAVASEDLNLGFAASNMGFQLNPYYVTKEDLPLDISIGVSKKLRHLPLRLSLGFHKLNESREDFVSKFKAFTIGAEFYLSSVLRLRLGYNNEKRNELKIGTTAGIAGFNIGLGALISDYRFDYGYSSLGSIGGLHRISVSTSL